MQDLLRSKTFRKIILLAIVSAGVCLAFGLGVFVGLKKADFSFRWAESYHQNFGSATDVAFMPQVMSFQKEFTDGYGCDGKIISKDSNSITVRDNDNTEKKIMINEKTVIMCQRIPFTIADLQADDDVVIIGEPDGAGAAKALLIRVFPQDKNCDRKKTISN